MPYEKNILIAQ